MVNDDNKIVEIWLTNADKKNLTIQNNLKLLSNEYKQQNFNVAVYESGKNDLFNNTASLLLHNRLEN